MSNATKEIQVCENVNLTKEGLENKKEDVEYELSYINVYVGDSLYGFNKKEIIHNRDNLLIVTVNGNERWHIRNAQIVEVYRPVTKKE